MKKIIISFFCLVFFPLLSQADILNPGPIVRIYNNSFEFVREFYAYDENLKIGVNVVVADFNNDQKVEIITAPQAGGGPEIRIFDIEGQVINNGWFAFSDSFRGGVNLAAGDVNGDQIPELITTQANQGQAWVKVYSLAKKEPKIISEFLAYPDFFEGGAYVTAGDINHDGKDEIITGAGYGGGPQVRIFNAHGKNLGLDFFPFPEDYHGGVTVAAGDLNNNGLAEIVVGQAYAAQAWVKVYQADAKTIISEFKAFPDAALYGVSLSVANTDKNKKSEIIASPGSGGGPQIRIFDASGKNINNFFGTDENFRGKTATNYYSGNYFITLAPIKAKRIITGPRIALTFDDGYNSGNGSLYKILSVLKKHNLQVTFFLLGDFIEKYPTEFQAIIADGHEIGNHSYGHPLFTLLTEAQIKQEIDSSENIMAQYGVNPWPVFRYPYGGHNAYTDAVIASLGYKYYQWTASTGDTGPNKSTQSAINGALYNLKDKGIILAHCQSDTTAAGLETIITAIQNAGYSIVKISELE